ncbi:MAG: hypothetical protein HQ596_03370 [Candidatus Saganbacteria bacterium]|nr:hypothetical protein [Candidatus Saganbacteria bacterium]
MRVIKTKKPLSKMRLKKPKHIVLLLADIINRVRFGEIDVKSANCIGALSGHMIRAMALVGIPPEPPEPVSYAEIIERWEKIFGVKLNHVDPEGERQLRVNNDRP